MNLSKEKIPNKKLINFCNKIINYGFPVLGFLIAIFFYLGSYDSCQIKITLFYIGATILISAWLIKIIEEGHFSISRSAIFILLPVFAFLISGIISFIFSPFKATSLDELIRRILYCGIFLIAFFEFSDLQKVKRLVFWLLGTGLLVSLYGLLQYFGLDPFGLSDSQEGRIFSTFGNPNWYVGFLIIVIPLILTLFNFSNARNIKKKDKVFSVILFVLLFINLLLAKSRSGYIGFAFAVGICVFLSIFFIFKVKKKTKIIFLASFLGILLFLTSLGVIHFNEERPLSISERKYIWIGALDLIEEHPFIGNGLGTFKINYPRVRRIESWYGQTQCNISVRDVYNEFLEIAQDEGILGLGIFLWLLTTIFYLGIRRLKENKSNVFKQYYIIAFLSGIFGLLASNLFSLNLRYVSSGFYFWLFLGVVGAQIYSPDPEEKTFTFSLKKNYLSRLFQFLIIAICLFLTFLFSRFFVADIYLERGVQHSRKAYQAAPAEAVRDIYITGTTYYSDPAEWELAIKYYLKAIKNNPTSIEAHYFLGNSYNRRWNMKRIYNPEWGDKNGQARTDAERALEEYDLVKKLAPDYIEIHFEVGNVYMKLGQWDKAIENFKKYQGSRPFFAKVQFLIARCYVQKKDWENAEKWYKEAIKLQEKFTQAYIELSTVYYMQKKYNLADEAYKKALEISPEYVDNGLGDAYMRIGEINKALKYFEKAVEVNPTDVNIYFKIAQCYIQKEDWDKAEKTYKKILELDDKNIIAYINLSNIYFAQDKKDLALAAYKKALEIDPEYVHRIINSKN